MLFRPLSSTGASSISLKPPGAEVMAADMVKCSVRPREDGRTFQAVPQTKAAHDRRGSFLTMRYSKRQLVKSVGW